MTTPRPEAPTPDVHDLATAIYVSRFTEMTIAQAEDLAEDIFTVFQEAAARAARTARPERDGITILGEQRAYQQGYDAGRSDAAAPSMELVAARPETGLREALVDVVQDYRNEAYVIHTSREGGFHEGSEWRQCISVQCVRMRAAIERAEFAAHPEELEAHEKAWSDAWDVFVATKWLDGDHRNPEEEVMTTPRPEALTPHQRCDIPACNCRRCHGCGDEMPEPMDHPDTSELRETAETGLRRDIDHLSVWAARYALGRMTYAVADVTETLTKNLDAVRPESMRVLVKDIDEAEERGNLGMEMDAERWRALRAALRAALETP